MENGAEKNISKESVSKIVTLSREISRINILGNNTPEADERARNFLMGNFASQYGGVAEMIDLARDPGRDENNIGKKNAKESLQLLGAAVLVAGQGRIENLVTSAEIYNYFPRCCLGIEEVLQENLLLSSKTDQVGKKIVEQLGILEKNNRRAALAPNVSDNEKKKALTIDAINNLFDVYDNVDPESIDGLKLGATIGCLDERIKKMEPNNSNRRNSTAENRQRNEGNENENDSGFDRATWEEIDRQARAAEAAEGKDPDQHKSPFWLMTPEDIVDEEMQQRGKQQFHLNPPYPDWYKESSQNDKDLWRVRCKLINGVAWKQIIRNKDVEKLMGNEAIDISRAELRLLYEMPHFKEALSIYFNDLFESQSDSPEGKNMLRIKRESGPKNTYGTILDASVEEKIVHFQKYKEILALKMQYPGRDIKELESQYSEYVKTANNRLKGQKLSEARKLLASDEYRSAVGAAWSFLYIGNTLESADTDRHLTPCEVVSDKLRTMIHPLQKAMGKWGVYKEGKNIDKLKDVTGEEEPMGGPLAAWIKYNLEMDEIKGLKYEDSFRKKLKEQAPGYRPLPKRMATSLVEMLPVNYENEKGELVLDEKGNPDVIPMSQAILEKKKITFDVVKTSKKNKNGEYIRKTKKSLNDKDEVISNEYEGHDYDVCVGFRDSMDGCKTAFDYLTGKMKMDPKSRKDWSLGFDKDISLVRQNATKYYSGIDGKLAFSHLKFVNNPEFLAWVIASSAGFDYRSEQIVLDLGGSINSYRDGYYNTIRTIVELPGLTKLGVDKDKVMSYLSADGSHNSTYWNLGKIEKEISKNEDLRKKDSKKRRSDDDQW